MLNYYAFRFKEGLSKIGLGVKSRSQTKPEKTKNTIKKELFNFEHIALYFSNKKTHNAFQVLSDHTCNDLDFDEVFQFLDRTQSRVGQQYLYDKLRCIKLDEAQTQEDEVLIERLSKDAVLRSQIQKELDRLKHKEAYYISSLFQEEHIQVPSWFLAIKLLSFTSFCTLILTFFNPVFFAVLLGVFCVNFVIHYWNKRNLVKYVSSIPQLLKLNKVANQLLKIEYTKPDDSKILKAVSRINQLKNRTLFFQIEAGIQGDFEIVLWFLLDIIKTLFLLEPLFLFGALKRLDRERVEVETVFKYVGRIDSLLSVALLRNGLNSWCTPHLSDVNTGVVAKEIYHPLISDCQVNSIETRERSVLLTGSNMSGKTTFIRTIGINILSGLTLNTCFAKQMQFRPMRILSAIRISDDLMNDKSYYFEEVLRIKALVVAGEETVPNLFLLDELFKGTNTAERIAAGKAVLSNLAQHGNTVLVSTHDIELTDLLTETYELYHFSEFVAEERIIFDYKLKAGKLKNRNAIRILELNKYPVTLIEEAKKLAADFDDFKNISG